LKKKHKQNNALKISFCGIELKERMTTLGRFSKEHCG
jgi:hypothetical protein